VCSVDIDEPAETACIDHRDRWGTLWWDFLLLFLLLHPLLLRDRLLSLLPLLLLLLLAPLTSRVTRSRHHGSIPLPTRCRALRSSSRLSSGGTGRRGRTKAQSSLDKQNTAPLRILLHEILNSERLTSSILDLLPRRAC